jgi:Ca2+-binding EF-hand superfamily protein
MEDESSSGFRSFKYILQEGAFDDSAGWFHLLNFVCHLVGGFVSMNRRLRQDNNNEAQTEQPMPAARPALGLETAPTVDPAALRVAQAIAQGRELGPEDYDLLSELDRSPEEVAAAASAAAAAAVETRSSESADVAREHAECPICFDALCSSPCGVFVDDRGKRVSPHIYNYQAAQRWLQENPTCPITRKHIASVTLVPDIRINPSAWFRIVDLDGDGKLSRQEVLDILKAQLPIDFKSLEEEAASGHLWELWDKDGDGYLDEDELLQENGLVSYVISAFAPSTAVEVIPDICDDREAWFAHFDEDSSGSLDKGEVQRALIKTLDLTPQMVDAVYQSIEAAWPIFDRDGSGSIDLAEFKRAAGLGDTIIAQLDLSACAAA